VPADFHTNRIIHTIPAISEEASGPSYSVSRLCDSLITQGYDLTLAALDWAPMPLRPAYLKTFPLAAGPRRMGRSPEMARWLNQQAAAHQIDLIHNHSLWMMPNVYPGRVAGRYGIPYVVSPRGTLSIPAMQSGSLFKRAFWPLVQKPSLAATTCFHATAHAEYEDIRRLGFRQPVAIIPNGIDIPPLRHHSSLKMRTLLFLGRIHPIKGLDTLLKAWKVIAPRHPDWHLQIAGPCDGGYLHELQSLSSKLGLARIDFSGPLYGEEKLVAYQKADLFVLPSHSENFGMSVAEALAAGTPAIVSKGAPWEGLNQRNAGWWLDMGVEPLIACLDDVLALPPSELAARGACGRRWMETDFSWAYISQKMAETYQWLLSGGSPPDCVVTE
jgi:glycosyltransferase involved in cell wall biosynthesis